MCIICNTNGAPEADQYLSAHYVASTQMKRAEAAMLACRNIVTDPDVRKAYDKAHKAMVRARKDWNRIEEIREAPLCAAHQP